MNVTEEKNEFEVLGCKVVFRPDENDGSCSAEEIVDFVHKEAQKIMEISPHLDKGQVSILLALKFAKDNLALNREYRENINKLQATAVDALQFIEGVSPATM